MMKTIHVQVPAPKKGDGKTTVDEEPRVCPIASADNPNGGNLMLKPAGFENLVGENLVEGPLEVYESSSIRRRIRSGDLEIVAAPKSAVKPAAKTKEG